MSTTLKSTVKRLTLTKYRDSNQAMLAVTHKKHFPDSAGRDLFDSIYLTKDEAASLARDLYQFAYGNLEITYD